MAASSKAAAPDLVMVDMGSPLQECVRRLQGQLARVKVLAAHEASDCSGVSPAHFFESLLQSYRGTSKTALSEAGKERNEEESVTALRRCIARKLRRLSEEQHMNLCVARSLEDDDMDAVAPSIECTATTSQTGANAHKHPNAAQPQRPEPAEEEDDVFGWVTEPGAAISVPAPTPSTVPITRTQATTTSADVDAILKRIALELADVVETRYRHADHLDDVYQQLLQLQHNTNTVLSARGSKTIEREGDKKEEDFSTSAPSDVVGSSSGSGDRLRDILMYRPKHTIASDREKTVWQRAWQSVLPAASDTAPWLQVGDAIELVDMAVLAHANAQRHAALQRRWSAVQKNYEEHVEWLNRRLAQAALQLEEMERRSQTCE